MIRTFIALEIPTFILDEVIQFRDKFYTDQNNVKWEPREKLHLTLKFLGDTKEEIVEKFCEKLSNIVSNFSKMNLELNNFGVFKRDGKLKILWIGIKDDINLLNLSQAIDNTCTEFGFEKERRKFNPHLTLLRVKGRENINQINKLLAAEFVPISFTAENVTLFKSDLKQSGSVYTALRKFNLK